MLSLSGNNSYYVQMNKILTLKNEVALVGGAGSGIGQAIALNLASRGAKLILLGRKMDSLEKTRDLLIGEGHRSIVCDFSDTGQVLAISLELSEAEDVSIVVHNTGGPPAGELNKANVIDLENAMKQHLISAQVLMQSFLPTMRSLKRGRFVTITSSSVVLPIKNLGVSNVVRAAVNNWVKTIAGELASENITVNNILPGFIDTERLETLFNNKASQQGLNTEDVRRKVINDLPINRIGTPEEIANVVAFLVSSEASYVTGVALPVDGGRLALR